jgi:hypothetical protein
MSSAAARLLITIAERSPLDGPILAVLPDPEEPLRNRDLLTYVRLRRLASEKSFADAEAEAARIAGAEPDLRVSRAFRGRWAEPPPKGLESGMRPLPQDDPLRVVSGIPIADTPCANPATVRRGDPSPFVEGEDHAAGPTREGIRLPARRLAFQMRCWSTLAELEARSARTAAADARADLLYKAAAILYHERDSLYPLYAAWTISRSGRPATGRFLGDGDDASAPWEWLRSNLPRLRAASAFRRLHEEFPSSGIAASAAYSEGLALVRSANEPPYSDAWQGWQPRDVREAAVALLGDAVRAFERCARQHPSSPLARDAAAAAVYWRRRFPGRY